MPLDRKILQEYVATANSGKYKSWDEINSKFPELKDYSPELLQEYVATANSGKYKSWEEIDVKFPEFDGGAPMGKPTPTPPTGGGGVNWPSSGKFGKQGVGAGVLLPSTSTPASPSVKPKSTTPSASTKPSEPQEAMPQETVSVKGEMLQSGYSPQMERNRQINYTKGYDRANKKAQEYYQTLTQSQVKLKELDAQLEQLRDNPQEFNALVGSRNLLAEQMRQSSDDLKSEIAKMEIYEKGLGVTALKREMNEDTAYNRATVGVNEFKKMIINTLPMIDRTVNYLTGKVMGLNENQVGLMSEALQQGKFGDIKDMSRELTKENEALIENFTDKSAWQEIVKKYDTGEGSIGDIADLAAKELMQTLPVTLGLAATYAQPVVGGVITVFGTAGSEIEEMDINNPNMSEGAKVSNALIKGSLEYVTEKIFGSIPIIGRALGMKSEAGKKLFTNVVTETWAKYAKKVGFPADVIEEVSSEMLNTLGQNYTDYITGKTSELDLKKDMGETFTTALTMAATLSGGGRAMKYGSKKINTLVSQTKKLKEAASDPNLSPDVVEAMQEKIVSNNEQIADEAEKEKVVMDAMPDDKYQETVELIDVNNNLQEQIDSGELPEDVVPVIEEKIKENEAKIEENKSAPAPEQIAEPDLKGIEGSVSDLQSRMNNAEYINEKEIAPVVDELYNILDSTEKRTDLSDKEKSAMMGAIESLINNFEQYEFTTETKTKTVTKRETVGSTKQTIRPEKETRHPLQIAEGSEVEVFYPDGNKVSGSLSNMGGEVVVSVKGGNQRVLGREELANRGVRLAEDGIQLNPDNDMLESVTLELPNGIKVKINSYEQALDLAVSIRENEIGHVEQDVFDDIIKEYNVEEEYEELKNKGIKQSSKTEPNLPTKDVQQTDEKTGQTPPPAETVSKAEGKAPAIDDNYKKEIEGKMMKFSEAIKNKKFPRVVDFVESILPENIVETYAPLYNKAGRIGLSIDYNNVPEGMLASFGGGSINLDIKKSKYNVNSYEEFAENLNHEIVHGLIYHGINSSDRYVMTKELGAVMDNVVSNFDKATDYIKDIISYIQDVRENYSETDYKTGEKVGELEELITYAFTDKQFAEFLDSIPASKDINVSGDTIFQQLKNILRNIISKVVGGKTAFDEISEIVDRYFDSSYQEEDFVERNKKYGWGHKTELTKKVADTVKKELTPDEKKNLTSIAKKSGISFREVQNVYAKYGEGKPISEITSEDFDAAQAKRTETKAKVYSEIASKLIEAKDTERGRSTTDQRISVEGKKAREKKAREIEKSVSDNKEFAKVKEISDNIEGIIAGMMEKGLIEKTNCIL